MPQKRHHKKSRYGCDQCRKRRVKCDEKRPICTPCAQREEDCHFSRSLFLSPNIFSSERSVSAESSPGIETSPPAVTPSESQSRTSLEPASQELLERSKELELMHQWCTRTCYSFSSDLADMFRDHVGRIALRHKFLLDAIFSLTSLHMACEAGDTSSVRTYVNTSLRYQNEAITGLRGALDNLTPSNCDAVFISTIVMMISAIVSPLISAGPEDEPSSTPEVVLSLIEYLNATRVIASIGRAWLMETPVSALFSLHKPGRSNDAIWHPAQRLLALNNDLVPSSSAEHYLFEKAIESLHAVFGEKHSLIVWLIRVPPEYMDEVRRNHPVALAIFMSWGVMLHQLGDNWWARYSGAKLVDDLSTSLSTHSTEFSDLILWCRVQVGL